MSDPTPTDAQPRRRSLLALLPLLIFLALTGVFLKQLIFGGDDSIVPSALIGTPAPVTDLPPVEGIATPGFSTEAIKGKLALVNVWASWCVPCRAEHPLLMELAKDSRFTLAGINYKDKPENAREFLAGLGNPFALLGADENGRAGINWGVYGVPETYLVSKDGTILWKQTGPFTGDSVKNQLMTEIEKALAAGR